VDEVRDEDDVDDVTSLGMNEGGMNEEEKMMMGGKRANEKRGIFC
jgi:hypothetical protein